MKHSNTAANCAKSAVLLTQNRTNPRIPGRTLCFSFAHFHFLRVFLSFKIPHSDTKQIVGQCSMTGQLKGCKRPSETSSHGCRGRTAAAAATSGQPSKATGGAGGGLANLAAARQQPSCCLGRMARAPVLLDALPKPGTKSKAFIE